VGIVLADVVVEVLETRAVELADLLEALLELEQLELGQVLVEVLGDGAAGRLEHRVPVCPVVVTRERDLVHYQGVLHAMVIIIIGGWRSKGNGGNGDVNDGNRDVNDGIGELTMGQES
jgi:hypothetical protein